MKTAALSLAGLFFLSGCCGGYAVVRTTQLDHAEVRPGGDVAVTQGDSAVLHYSRLGEPPNACGSGAQYVEDLWMQVPSLAQGSVYTLGAPGVVATYTRDQGAEKVGAKSITGKLTIKDRDASRVVVGVDVAIALPSGDVVKIDDDYDFHPVKAGQGRAPSLYALAPSCSRAVR
jgi:hypothetical protein